MAEYGLPVIADYGSEGCIPCKQMAPVLETMNEEFSGKAFIKFADVWKYQDSAGNVPIQLIPTQVLFHADGIPFLALLAGILTSFTPCSLSNIPLIIGYVGSAEEKIQKSLSVFSHFCIGNSNNICFVWVDCNIGGEIIGYFLKAMVFGAWHIDGAYGVTDMGDFSGHSVHELDIKK